MALSMVQSIHAVQVDGLTQVSKPGVAAGAPRCMMQPGQAQFGPQSHETGGASEGGREGWMLASFSCVKGDAVKLLQIDAFYDVDLAGSWPFAGAFGPEGRP